MKTKNLILSGMLMAGLFMFNACDKNDSAVMDSDDVDTDVVEQSVSIEDLEESIFDEIDVYLSQESELAAVSELKSALEDDEPQGCPTVYVDRPEDARYPKVVTFDFGEENCEDRFGRMKRGKVIVTVTNRHWVEGATRTVEFEDFYVNDNGISGSKVYTNEGKNDDDKWYFSTVINITIETTEGITWTRTVDRTRTMIAGDDTRNVWDDAFLITGGSSGTSSEGYSVTREITVPVYRERVCRFPLSGNVEIVRVKDDVSKTVWLDYGSSDTCDNKATVTDEDGNVKEISLGGRFNKK
ncbi:MULTISPECIES: hypothetical protein [unclassified Saccharicrinis]|uniref:hypothetical protein n=1 Tax=unclassified Saccharicrinis TaxID=2646859 RepID=UPI003D3273CA